jgi:ABC-2 type transport system ATP-binding protein
MGGIIDTKELTIDYGNHLALKNITVQLNENQLIGLIGRNGSGKTTFMKACAGLLHPSTGEVKVLNHNPMNNIVVLEQVIYSYPGVPFHESNTLARIIQCFKMFYTEFDQVFAEKLLSIFSLKPTLRYNNLSQGMSSLFNFICALSTRAKITLLDEPVVGMDVTVRKKVYEILLRDYMEYPRTIVISSHMLSEMEDILSEILLIDNGTLIFYKDMEEVSSMAYRVDGAREDIEIFIRNRYTLYKKYNTMSSFAIIDGNCDSDALKISKDLKLNISKVRPEELCVYITKQNGEEDIECLWEK